MKKSTLPIYISDEARAHLEMAACAAGLITQRGTGVERPNISLLIERYAVVLLALAQAVSNE